MFARAWKLSKIDFILNDSIIPSKIPGILHHINYPLLSLMMAKCFKKCLFFWLLCHNNLLCRKSCATIDLIFTHIYTHLQRGDFHFLPNHTSNLRSTMICFFHSGVLRFFSTFGFFNNTTLFQNLIITVFLEYKMFKIKLWLFYI